MTVSTVKQRTLTLSDQHASRHDSRNQVSVADGTTEPRGTDIKRGTDIIGSLSIHLLGRPSVEVDQRATPGPRGRKAWGLLAFLLLSRLPPSRSALADLLFADADDPLATLRWNLAELRRSLGPGAELGGDPVTLTLPWDTPVDVLLLSSGTWVEAIRLPALGQELLDGIDVHGSAAFEAWLVAERRHTAGLSAAILREAATARMAAGDAQAAIPLATKLVRFDEFDEEAHALLIRAFVGSGAEDSAQTYLASTTEMFRRELGVEPTATLLRSIDGAAATAPGPAWVRGGAAIESLVVAGEAAVGAGVFDAGLEILRRAVADAREANDRGVEARALVALGTAFVHGARGRDGEGATVLHEAVSLAEELDAAALVSEATRELGYIEMKQARYERAEVWLDRAIDIAPDRGTRAAAMAIRGAVVGDQGRSMDAAGLLTAAAADAHELGKPRLEAWALTFLGRGHVLREDWTAARTTLIQAIEVTRAAGWMTYLAFPQSLLATVELAEGNVDEAATSFESAFALGCQIGDPCWEGMAARGIGLVHLARGRIDEAVTWLDDARTRCVRIPDAYLWVHAYCLDALCDAATAHGLPAARAWVRDLETLAARTGMNELLVRAHLHRAASGEPGAVDAARLFAERIDNPAVIARTTAAPAPIPEPARP